MSTKLIPPKGNEHSAEAMATRRKWLAEVTGQEISEHGLDAPEKLRGLIENQIGEVTLPLAIAGPLSIHGSFGDGLFYVPLCALEGTLALSMTRGLYLTHLNGGIHTQHIGQKLNRSPVFFLPSIREINDFSQWLDKHIESIRVAAEAKSNHARLVNIEKIPHHGKMLLNFIFTTGDAAGQNMVTICTQEACQYICAHYPKPISFLIESNYAGDKNAAQYNLVTGRGHSVVAQCHLQERYIRRVLHSDIQTMISYRNNFVSSSLLAGVLGLNAHAANALAAIYIATGQDAACVAENCTAYSEYEVTEKGELFASLHMPSITVGTVGGGTRLAQQRANLSLIGCTGDNSAVQFAEIIGACVLALELSLLGAVTSNEFTQAHIHYGR